MYGNMQKKLPLIIQMFVFFKKALTPFCKKGVGPKFVGFLWHFLNLPAKLYNPSTYYKHLKKGAHQSQLGTHKKRLVSGRLAYTSSKTEILNKIGI